MRAVIYCRVSSTEQTKNLSLPTQEGVREYCERTGTGKVLGQLKAFDLVLVTRVAGYRLLAVRGARAE